MFAINDDLSIHVTRGDIVFFAVTMRRNEEIHNFKPDDIVRIKVFEKKNCDNVVLQKSFAVTEETESVDIVLTKEDTKIGEVISKPVVYWYEIELNPFTNPQTIVGYDEDGAKTFTLYPEGADTPEDITDPEDIPVVDTDFDLTSPRPVANFVITGKFNEVDEALTEVTNKADNAQKTADEAKALAENAGSGEAQDISNGYKKSVSVMGYIYEGLVKVSDCAPVRHKTYFTKVNGGSGGVCYVVPMNIAPKSWDINTKVEIAVPPSANMTLRIGGVSVDASGSYDYDTGVKKLWELVATDDSVISSGTINCGLAYLDITLTDTAKKLVIYSADSKESSEGVTSQIQWTGVTLSPDIAEPYEVGEYEPREIIKTSNWVYENGEYRAYIDSIDQDTYYVWVSSSENTYHYNADINTVIGSGGSGISFVSGTMTLSADQWSESSSHHTFKYWTSGTAFQCGEGESVKMIIIDLTDTATLEQRRAAEQACIYASHYLLGPNSGYYDGFINFGMTGATKPTVDIPIKYTVVTG